MRSIWQRWRDPLGLYARLEARRSKARPEFVRRLADELGESRPRARTPLRLALVGALTAVMLIAAAAVAAARYQNEGLVGAISPVSSSGNQAVANDDDDDDDGDDGPDDDQYEEEREECEEAVDAAHDDFHAELAAEHRLFHQGGGASGHSLFHRGLDADHRGQHRVFASALDECEAIGGGGRRDDDDDD